MQASDRENGLPASASARYARSLRSRPQCSVRSPPGKHWQQVGGHDRPARAGTCSRAARPSRPSASVPGPQRGWPPGPRPRGRCSPAQRIGMGASVGLGEELHNNHHRYAANAQAKAPSRPVQASIPLRMPESHALSKRRTRCCTGNPASWAKASSAAQWRMRRRAKLARPWATRCTRGHARPLPAPIGKPVSSTAMWALRRAASNWVPGRGVSRVKRPGGPCRSRPRA